MFNTVFGVSFFRTFPSFLSFGGDLGVGVGVGDLYLLEGGIRIGDFGYKTSCASTSIIVSCIILPALYHNQYPSSILRVYF